MRCSALQCVAERPVRGRPECDFFILRRNAILRSSQKICSVVLLRSASSSELTGANFTYACRQTADLATHTTSRNSQKSAHLFFYVVHYITDWLLWISTCEHSAALVTNTTSSNSQKSAQLLFYVVHSVADWLLRISTCEKSAALVANITSRNSQKSAQLFFNVLHYKSRADFWEFLPLFNQRLLSPMGGIRPQVEFLKSLLASFAWMCIYVLLVY